jgi:hypothetical protein
VQAASLYIAKSTMDISQACPFLKISAFATTGWTIFHFAVHVQRRLKRALVKTLGACVWVSGVLAGLVLFLGNLLFSKNVPPLYS